VREEHAVRALALAAAAEETKRKEEFDVAVAAASAVAVEAAAANFTNANFPMSAEGHVYHLGIRMGEIANRIVSVGDSQRAALIASYLDPLPETGAIFKHSSKRGFTVYTGLFHGVRMSVVATGMGMAMMDFVVRECRAVVEGQMAVCRLGTCGLLDAALPVGTVVVASPGSVAVRREPDAFSKPVVGATPLAPYRITNLVPSDPELSRLLLERLRVNLGDDKTDTRAEAEDSTGARTGHDANPMVGVLEEQDDARGASSGDGGDHSSDSDSIDGLLLDGERQLIAVEPISSSGGGGNVRAAVKAMADKDALATPSVVAGLNCTADSFYSSQGRTSGHFDDRNDNLIEAILAGDTSAASLEMETFHLLDLARCSQKVNGRPGIVAAAAAIGLAQRKSNTFIESDRVERLERLGGISLLEALAARHLHGADNYKPSDSTAHSAEGVRGVKGAEGVEGAEDADDAVGTRESTELDAGESSSEDGGNGKGPIAWLKAYAAKSKAMAAKVQALGLAGVTAYGIFNTLYYTLAFTVAWYFQKVPEGVGLMGTAKVAAKVMGVVWAGSQVTKLLRFGLAIAAAPKVDIFMKWTAEKTGKSYQATFGIVTGGCLLTSLALFGAMIASKAAGG
jgi:uridine phosphorylase